MDYIDINLHMYNYLTFDKNAKKIPWRKDIIFNAWCWDHWPTICRRIKVDSYFSPYTEINSK